MRYAALVSYDGTSYHGWQRQKGSKPTVQGEIESVLSTLNNAQVPITGCGRTDTGVHALGYVFHFDMETLLDLEKLKYKMNRMLSDCIHVSEIKSTSDNFHARYDAMSRSYRYQMRLENDPFDNRFTLIYPYAHAIDLHRLNEAAALIKKYEDFTPFSKEGSDNKTNICQITTCQWTYDEHKSRFHFDITANRFLRGMIRLIVGACLNYNRGKLSLSEIKEALEASKRLPIDWSVSGKGLVLHQIMYPNVTFETRFNL